MRTYLTVLWLLTLASAVRADGVAVPIRVPAQPDISVYEPGQKALIGWNGISEVLILSTDVSAQEESKALQIVPLPSEPEIERASFNAFTAVGRAIRRHAPLSKRRADSWDGSATEASEPGVSIVFHKRIGAHDITVAKANNYQEFVEWAEAFVSTLGPERPRFSNAFQEVITSLVKEDICYFAFDVVHLGNDAASVEPISYEFETDSLYYPLRISSLMEGYTDIQVFLISQYPVDLRGNRTVLRPAMYYSSEGAQPIRFILARSEVGEISDHIAALVGGRDAYFAALEYNGPLASFKRDLKLAYERTPFDPRTRRLFLRKHD